MTAMEQSTDPIEPATSNVRLTHESLAAQSFLQMLQQVVDRLASNSASCKTWCITLTSAITVVVAESGKAQLLLVAALPILLFMALDAYYLGLERRFRGCYEDFLKKLNNGTARADRDLLLSPPLSVRGWFPEAFEAVGSFSIWPFYLGMAVILVVLGMRLG